MFNHDVAELYKEVSVGTPVHLIYYPIKAGWKNNQLYLEAYSPVKHINGYYTANALSLHRVIAEVMPENSKRISLNKEVINQVLHQQNGQPQMIGSVSNE